VETDAAETRRGDSTMPFLKTTRACLLVLAAACLPAQSPSWIGELRDLAFKKDVAGAQTLLETERPGKGDLTSEWLAGVSWVARGASFAGHWEIAEKYAREALEGSQALLKVRSFEQDSNLETSLGAAIEVLGAVQNAAGDRVGAAEFLRRQREAYRGTPIETRIQKNFLLLSLEGKPMPALETAQYLGRKPRTAADLKGKVTLFFFWAHWCSDCKRQKPILEALHEKYADRGFTVVGPTRLYGYVARGMDATAEQEMDYLKNAYQQQNPVPAWMDAPVSTQNFVNFGVSTTPTLVLVDREGIVRLYHPGGLSHEELATHIEKLLG
jgi:thiol-disulfide isomerase/thioredoxin